MYSATTQVRAMADSIQVEFQLQDNDLTRRFIETVIEDIILFDKKQSDRGPTNIAAFAEKGILIRCFDKMARLKTILWDGREPKVSEPIENEWADLSVYGVIARICMKGEWPGVGSVLDKIVKYPAPVSHNHTLGEICPETCPNLVAKKFSPGSVVHIDPAE